MFTLNDLTTLFQIRNVVCIAIIIILSLVAYHGSIIWCILVGSIFILVYYLLKRFFGEDEKESDEKRIARLEETLEKIYIKWAEIGSPINMKEDVNLIQFFYSIKPWRLYNSDSYYLLINQTEMLLSTNSNGDKSKIRDKCLITLQDFSRLSNYTSVVNQFQNLTLKYI